MAQTQLCLPAATAAPRIALIWQVHRRKLGFRTPGLPVRDLHRKLRQGEWDIIVTGKIPWRG
jgi:hypothetical protein